VTSLDQKSIDRATTWLLNRRRKILRSRYVPSAVFGLLLLALGYHIGEGPVHLLLEGRRTIGTVVGYERRLSGGKAAAVPVIEFQADGQPIRFQDWLSGKGAVRQGELVGVLYDVADPSDAMLDRPILKWMPWGPCVALGLLLTLSSLSGWLRSRRR
jgi:hypothetical protein